ncbi:DUF2523 domain-containing protein [Dyella sp. S184]|uniref:DUF2523 domain-containing protein n=1 Tax=Dyella sp. S184 TaxID=1641862 RepID=UPI00131B6191|nr:DUF2523 domain-containing protein [Dyella sp. S184]
MPILVAWIGEMLLSIVGQMVISGLLAVGIGFASHAAVSGLINNSSIFAEWKASGAMWNWVGFLHLDTDVTIYLSAWAGRMLTDAAKVRLTALPKAPA